MNNKQKTFVIGKRRTQGDIRLVLSKLRIVLQLIKTLTIFRDEISKVKMRFCLIALLVLAHWTESASAQSYFPASSGNFFIPFLFYSFTSKKKKQEEKKERTNRRENNNKKEGEKEERERIKTNKPIFIVIFVRVFENIPKCIF